MGSDKNGEPQYRAKGISRRPGLCLAKTPCAPQKKLVHAFVRVHDIVHEKIDPTLVAGIKVTINDEMQFDGTMKAKLDKLFT